MPLIVMGSLLTSALYHLALFLMNRKRKTELVFAVCCLLYLIMAARPATLFFSEYNLELFLRIEYIVFYSTFAMSVLLFSMIVPKFLHKWIARLYFSVCGLFLLTVILLDTTVFTSLIQFFYPIGAFMALYCSIRMIMTLRSGKAQNILAFIGLLVLAVFGVADVFSHMLVPLHIVRIPFFFLHLGLRFNAIVGMVFFVFCYALLLALRYAETERAAAENERLALEASTREQITAAENAALERVNHLRAEIIETISHEARTPLAVLASYAGLVALTMQKKNTDPQTAADLDKIAFEAKRVANLVSHIKNLSIKKESAAKWIVLDFGSLVEQTASLYHHILERVGVNLITEIPPELPPVYGSPEELTQVVFNLLQNAKNHTTAGSVTIKLYADDKMLTTFVTDTGTGIKRSLLPNIFERGVYGGENGTGIGLAICKDVVTAHGGTIDIESEQGKGTTVTFTLPRTHERTGREASDQPINIQGGKTNGE
jgi:signal transduction histidine kinase